MPEAATGIAVVHASSFAPTSVLVPEIMTTFAAALAAAEYLGVIRAGEIAGESTVCFLGNDEEIILTRLVFDRHVHATGSVLAARWAAGRAPGFHAMRQVMEGG